MLRRIIEGLYKMNVGQKILNSDPLTKYGVAPIVGGSILGTGYGIYENFTNPYADHSLSSYAIKGGMIGAALGGIGATSSRLVAEHKAYKAGSMQTGFYNGTKNSILDL